MAIAVAGTVLPMILEPTISLTFKAIVEALQTLRNCSDDIQSLFRQLGTIKLVVSDVSNYLVYTSSGSGSPNGQIVTKSVKHWVERWSDVFEDAEDFINEGSGAVDHGMAGCIAQRRRNNRKLKQIRNAMKELLEEMPAIVLSYLATNRQNEVRLLGNVIPSRRAEMGVITNTSPHVERLQLSASGKVTVGHGNTNGGPLHSKLIHGDIEDHHISFAVMAGSGRAPILGTVSNCDEARWSFSKGNPHSVLLHSDCGQAQSNLVLQLLRLPHPDVPTEMVIKISCLKDISVTTTVNRALDVEALSEEERWGLFHFHAFQNGDQIVHPEMEQIGGELFHCLRGLPFLTEAVAKLLAKINDRFYWQLKLAQFRKVPDRLHDRYAALPFYCKLCFISFAAFPKGAGPEIENLIELWIGEGLIRTTHPLIDPVSLGYQVVKLLIQYRLIEVSEIDWAGRPVCCTMQDRIRYMAIQIADQDEGCLFRPDRNLERFPFTESYGCRSISLMKNDISSLPKTSGWATLRSLLLRDNLKLNRVPSGVFKGLSSLRVLDLSNTGIVSMPESLGDLKRLGFLQLSHAPLESLPKSIIRLKKLQTLILSSCNRLKHLPTEIRQLELLRHLDVSGCRSLKSLPRGITELGRTLHTLKMNGTQVWQCRSEFLENRAECLRLPRKIACLSSLKDLAKLKRLHLDCEHHSSIPLQVLGGKMEMQNLWLRMTKLETLPEDMQEMTQLEELQLWNCTKLQELPIWFCDLLSLRFLCLNCCCSLNSLPALQTMPLLRVLRIEYCDALMEVPAAFGSSASFPSLQSLMLIDLNIRALPTFERGAMPKLNRLALKGCKNLRRLPTNIQYLENLQTLDVSDSDFLIQRMSEGGEDEDTVKTYLLHVQIIPNLDQNYIL